MSEKLVFAQTFEGVFRAVGTRLTPALMAGLRERGVDPERQLLPAYPVETFVEVVRYLSAQLYPDASEERSVVRLARDFMDGFGHTLIGRALMAMMRLIGPDASLKRVTQEFRTGNNFSEGRLTQRAPRVYEMWVNYMQLPGWYIGILARGLEIAGAKGHQVRLVSREGDAGTLHLEWH